MKAILLVVWSLALLTVVAAGVLCWRFLGVHEGGLTEIYAIALSILVMVTGTTLALGVSGIVWALRGGKSSAP